MIASVLAAVLLFSTSALAHSAEPGRCGPRSVEECRQACRKGVREACRTYLLSSSAVKAERWPRSIQVTRAPEDLLEYLRVDNLYNGFDEQPRSPKPDPDFDAAVRSVFQRLPRQVRRAVEGKLAGIFLVEKLGSTAFALNLRREGVFTQRSLIVIDAEKIRAKANEWATWKESSVFSGKHGFQLRVQLETPHEDSAERSIEYALLHEIGHVLDYARGIVPDEDKLEPSSTARYPFSGLSWRMTADGPVSRYESGFSLRRQVRFYGNESQRLPIEAAEALYGQIAATDFPSLYAATSMRDDFAESFAGYVHVILQGRPHRVLLRQGGKRVFEIDFAKSCWNSPRCAGKRAFFEKLLGAP